MPRGPGKKTPLTDVERQKGFNIRHNVEGKSEKSTRDLKNEDVWNSRNTKGNPKKKPK